MPIGRERGETGATPSFQGFVRHGHRWKSPTSGAVPHSPSGGSLPSHLSLQEGSDSRKEHRIVSAVRLFCFLIGMVFQQIPPLLLLVSYYLFLITCMGVVFHRKPEVLYVGVVAWIGVEMEFALSQAIASGDAFEPQAVRVRSLCSELSGRP